MGTTFKIILGNYGETCLRELVEDTKEKAEKESPENAEITKRVADEFLEKIGGTIEASLEDITEDTATDLIRFGMAGIFSHAINDEIDKAKAKAQ